MRIAIIGYSCTGKTTLCHAMAQMFPGYRLIHTDEYYGWGFEQAMYKAMDDVMSAGDKVICEGVHAYRMLRKGIEEDNLHFDLIIECKTPNDVRISRYQKERDPAKMKSLPGFDKSLDKIYSDFKTMAVAKGKLPHIIEYRT